MALSIKDPEAERLAAEVAALAQESKTRAVRVALQERKQRLALKAPHGRRQRALREFLAQEVWPQVPDNELGKPISRKQREEILGYSPAGV